MNGKEIMIVPLMIDVKDFAKNANCGQILTCINIKNRFINESISARFFVISFFL